MNNANLTAILMHARTIPFRIFFQKSYRCMTPLRMLKTMNCFSIYNKPNPTTSPNCDIRQRIRHPMISEMILRISTCINISIYFYIIEIEILNMRKLFKRLLNLGYQGVISPAFFWGCCYVSVFLFAVV